MSSIPLATSLTPAAEAVIDLGAIANNVRVLREHAGSAAVMVVVKADGYGHGATRVAQASLAAGASELGVATVDEGLALRRDGITAPILAWLHPPGTDFAPALRADVQIAVSSVRQLSELIDAARQTGVAAAVTVKIDTGLNRNGVSAADYPGMLDALVRAQADEAVTVRGLMTHMVYADKPDHPTNNLQAQRFSDAIAQARSAGVRYEVAHLANSSSAMSRPDLAYDMIRPGIAVYGLSPIPQRGQMGLIPAMTLRCPVTLVKRIRAGEGVSYGHIWTAEHDTTLALMPIGYADGVQRILSGRFDVLINGKRRPSVGRICMDQFLVDLGPGETDVREGDTAILFGPGSDGEPTAQEWADLLDTIHYEVVTLPRGRVVRVYRGGGAGE
ncbi:MAG: alanine racemase [Mycobacterium sp.]|jgi:alanine racemase|nr:alanine racemase [Mycobacterium sp.]